MSRRHLHLVENWPADDLRTLDILLAATFLLGVVIGALAMWAFIS